MDKESPRDIGVSCIKNSVPKYRGGGVDDLGNGWDFSGIDGSPGIGMVLKVKVEAQGIGRVPRDMGPKGWGAGSRGISGGSRDRVGPEVYGFPMVGGGVEYGRWTMAKISGIFII